MSKPSRDLAAYLASEEYATVYARRTAAHVDRQWREAAQAAEACAQGDCLYAKRECQPRPSEYKPQPACLFKHNHGCIGYRGTKHMERGLSLMRYGICPRHRAWWDVERERIRKRKQKEEAGRKGKAPKSWE